jgi:predicted CXXCH cytochrome family protein|tara:strand:- start:358 stop:558 length:201 start_codon:yes stop_codon:yes gene_type:complete
MRQPRDFPSFVVWDKYKICDWCGRSTRGKTYYDDPAVVYCTSCHTALEGNPKDLLKADVDKYCGPS